jgi:hypothetical protein
MPSLAFKSLLRLFSKGTAAPHLPAGIISP